MFKLYFNVKKRIQQTVKAIYEEYFINYAKINISYYVFARTLQDQTKLLLNSDDQLLTKLLLTRRSKLYEIISIV